MGSQKSLTQLINSTTTLPQAMCEQVSQVVTGLKAREMSLLVGCSGAMLADFVTYNQDFYLIQLLLAAKTRRINKSLENVVRKKARDDTQIIIPHYFPQQVFSLAFHSPRILVARLILPTADLK